MIRSESRIIELEKKDITDRIVRESKPGSKSGFSYCYVCCEVFHGVRCPLCGVRVTK